MNRKLTCLLILIFLLSGCSSTMGLNTVRKPIVTCIADLEGKTIGVQLGTAEDLAASKIDDATIVEYNSPHDAIQALSQDKLDCVIINEQAAASFVEKDASLRILEEAFGYEEAAICIAKDNDDLTMKLNEIISEIKSDGTLASIMDYYLDDDYNGERYSSPNDTLRNNGTLTVATNAEFEPYEYIEHGEYVGIDMDICRVLADKLGMELVIEDMQFASIITAVTSGKADIGVAGMAVTEERAKSVNFTTPLYNSAKQVILVHDGTYNLSETILDRLYDNFIVDDRYKSLLSGLGVTLLITLFAEIIGLTLGLLIAFIRYTHDKLHIMHIGNFISQLYLLIIRGTPSVIQLLIIYYVIFASANINKVVIATLAFGINSAAYVAEIIRSGWNSIDNGQYEAGRSMGFNYFDTMRLFILPQAFKNIVPTLGNEFIVLLKETAISGYIGIFDLTRAGDYIRSRTYEALLPLVSVALIYLIIVMIMSFVVSYIERRLNRNGK